MPIKISRPFNNYGPGLNINDKRVIPDFFKDILKNKDISLFPMVKRPGHFAIQKMLYMDTFFCCYLTIMLNHLI